MERSKKKVQLWKRAIVHFSLCFVMGFFTGFAPTAKSSFFSTRNTTSSSDHKQQPHRSSLHDLQPHLQPTVLESAPPAHLVEHTAFSKQSESTTTTTTASSSPGRLVIMVTPTRRMREVAGLVLLRRLADTVRLVEPPLLWIVVEGAAESKEVSEVLRKTGVMYRHLVVKENFTDPDAELNHHRNVALKHIEQHRLSGIVHFADLSNVYDLDFFHHLRDIEVFGTWAVALLLSANRKKVIIEGPVCDSSQVIGWHLGKMIKQTKEEEEKETDHQKLPPPLSTIHISNFAFNSSILWDPERWGRPTSVQGTSQNSLKFVKQVVFDDETKLKGIPSEECSKIMLWRLHLPLVPPSTHQPASIMT